MCMQASNTHIHNYSHSRSQSKDVIKQETENISTQRQQSIWENEDSLFRLP